MKRAYLSPVLTFSLMVLLIPASALGQNPSMVMGKYSYTDSLDWPGTVTYRYHMLNTGNVTLTGISLSDDNDNDDVSCPATTLDPGEPMDCTATHTFTQAELDANGSPTAGSGVLFNTVTASSNELPDATSELGIPIVQNPSMVMGKYSYTDSLDWPGTVTYRYHMLNTGNVTLTGISLSDDNDNDDASCPATTLDPGEVMDTCTATHTLTQAELDANGSPTAGSGVLSNTVTASSNEAPDATSFLSIPIGQGPPTPEQIQQSINEGVTWLADHQNADGSWNNNEEVAHTCFALIKLQDRAYELGYDSPFDPAYPYVDNVISGWEFVLDPVNHVIPKSISIQVHGSNLDDPDTNGNGFGVSFLPCCQALSQTYTTGICLMALGSTGTPDRLNEGMYDFTPPAGVDTYLELAQDVADWLAFAQGDAGHLEGGWTYEAIDNNNWIYGADNSISGYAMLGLAEAISFGCTVPDWVARELDVWIGMVQDPVDGDTNDGGSIYSPPGPGGWVNELKTGNLIFEMTYYGDDPAAPRFGDALDYISRHWRDTNIDPGWGYGVVPANYQAMFTLMKGF